MAHWDDPSFEAPQAAKRLSRLGIDISEAASHWVERLLGLQRTRPEPQPHNEVAQMIANGAKESDIRAASAQHLSFDHRRTQHVEAERICGSNALHEILRDRVRLHNELAVTANELIEKIHVAARIDENLVELTRQGRGDEAYRLSVIESDTDELRECYEVRDMFLTVPGEHWKPGWWDCSQCSNPWDVAHHTIGSRGDENLWDIWRASIRAGAILWFPSLEQARAAALEHQPIEQPQPQASYVAFG